MDPTSAGARCMPAAQTARSSGSAFMPSPAPIAAMRSAG